jgi:hypothetical protein
MTTTHGESEFARTAKLTSHVSSSSRPIGTRIKSAQAPEAAGHCVWSGGRRLHGHRRYAERPRHHPHDLSCTAATRRRTVPCDIRHIN